MTTPSRTSKDKVITNLAPTNDKNIFFFQLFNQIAQPLILIKFYRNKYFFMLNKHMTFKYWLLWSSISLLTFISSGILILGHSDFLDYMTEISNDVKDLGTMLSIGNTKYV